MKKLYLLVIATILVQYSYAQTNVQTWNRLLESVQLDKNVFFEECPNFPSLEADANFASSVASWEKSHPDELSAFWSNPKIAEANPSAYYLGLEFFEPNNYTNSMVQWIEESGIPDTKFNAIAPHFPSDPFADDIDAQISSWIILYGHEYERLLNDRRLTKLNPYYTDYVDAVILPKFISALESKEKPQAENFKSNTAYTLNLQTWYYVFKEKQFESQFGFTPILPEWFNASAYREMVVQRIEANEQAVKDGVTDPDASRN